MGARKATARSPRKKAPRTKATTRNRKTVAKRKSTTRTTQGLTPAESLARKIVRFANQREKIDLTELYSETCVSRGPQRVEVSGIPALRAKFDDWDAVVTSQKWTARNTFVKGNRICIEWQCQLTLRDGRELDFEEVAVHEVRGGRIVAERYYYDPSVLASPRKEDAAPAPKPEEEPTRLLPVASPEEAPGLAAELVEEPPKPIPEENVPQGTPPLDPLDL
jgi:hypothetical protein